MAPSRRRSPAPPGSCDDGRMADLELLDCGDGRRLERFGDVIVDRPAPTATLDRHLAPAHWAKPTLRWAKSAWVRGRRPGPVAGRAWPASRSSAGRRRAARSASSRSTPPPGRWLDKSVRDAAVKLGRQPRVLSLFAYTGGATLACARAGAAVAHVDSSRARARLGAAERGAVGPRGGARSAGSSTTRARSSSASAAAARPTTASSSTRRSYGHGKGAWQIDEHLPALLDDIAAIVGPKPSFIAPQRPHAGLRRGAAGRARAASTSSSSGHGEALVTRSRAGGDARARRLGARPAPLSRCRCAFDDVAADHEPEEPARPGRRGPPRPARAGRGRPHASSTARASSTGRSRAAPRSSRCSSTTAGLTPAGRDAVDRARAAGAEIVAVQRRRRSPGSPTATAPRDSWPSSRSRTSRSRRCDLRPDPLVVVARGRSRSRATWAPCCGPPMRPAPTP